MTKMNVAREKRTLGDTAVDGLIAGLGGGMGMSLFLALADWARGGQPTATLGLFDPAQSGSWLLGLLAHLAVSGIYGVGLAVLLRGVGNVRPLPAKWSWAWGAGYGLLLWGLAAGTVLTAVASPLDQIPAWEFGLAHLLYGLVVGYRLQTNQLGE